ncbi:MAG: hypothetical protein WC604_02740 [Candidatus Gracilibacteria bacterium]
MSTDDRQIVPDPAPTEEVAPASDTAGAVADVLAGKTLKESQVEDPMAKTLDQFLKELEQEKTPTAIDKVRKIQRVLMFVGRHVDVKTNKILLKRQAGLGVGEAFEDHAEIDPILFDNEHLNEDHLTVMRHVLLHELFHMEKDIPNEGLAEVASSRLSSDKVRDYENLVQNVLQVTGAIGAHFHNGDKDQGILETVQLYSERKYDKLFEQFKVAYEAANSQAVAANPDVAEKVFQLAFPELVFEADESGTAKWREDEETTEEVRAKVEEEGTLPGDAGNIPPVKIPVEETPPEETPVE